MTSVERLNHLRITPIQFQYKRPHDAQVRKWESKKNIIALRNHDDLVMMQSYYRAGHAGSSPQTYTRLAISELLEDALQVLENEYGILVFDAYRSIQTQRALFDFFEKEIQEKNPDWTPERVTQEAHKYVFHPDQKSKYPIPPHNSGGAIDLALHQKGKMIDFGTAFDDPSPQSATAFFEQDYDPQFGYTLENWNQIRSNRRLLFNLMCSLGFTNYLEEWWHYDLGNCPWASKFDLPWFFGSMESELISGCP